MRDYWGGNHGKITKVYWGGNHGKMTNEVLLGR